MEIPKVKDSNSEENMVAQLGNDPGKSQDGKFDPDKEHSTDATAMEGDVDLLHPGSGKVDLFTFSGSDSGKDTELSGSGSPFTSNTPKASGVGGTRRKRASSLNVPISRIPTPPGITLEAPRLQHRRISPAADAGNVYPAQQHDKIKQLEAQNEADREAMTGVRDAIMKMHERLVEHDNTLKKLQMNDTTINKNLIGIEANVLKRVEETKAFIMKNSETKVAESERRVLDGVERELNTKNTITRFIMGTEKDPVLQPLIHTILRDKMEDINAKFLKLHDFMNERHEKEAQVQAYLDSLKEQRPEEGKVVKEAFSNLAVEIL